MADGTIRQNFRTFDVVSRKGKVKKRLIIGIEEVNGACLYSLFTTGKKIEKAFEPELTLHKRLGVKERAALEKSMAKLAVEFNLLRALSRAVAEH